MKTQCIRNSFAVEIVCLFLQILGVQTQKYGILLCDFYIITTATRQRMRYIMWNLVTPVYANSMKCTTLFFAQHSSYLKATINCSY